MQNNCTSVLLYFISNIHDYAFIYLHTQSKHFDNFQNGKVGLCSQKIDQDTRKNVKNSNYEKIGIYSKITIS